MKFMLAVIDDYGASSRRTLVLLFDMQHRLHHAQEYNSSFMMLDEMPMNVIPPNGGNDDAMKTNACNQKRSSR